MKLPSILPLRTPVWLTVLLGAALVLLAAAALWWLLDNEVLVQLAHLNTWLADNFIHRLGYWGVFLLMMLESSFIPFPSEIVMPPAGDLARRLPHWSLSAVILSGTLGSLAGAVVNYMLARMLGRPMVLELLRKGGGWLRLSEAAYQRAEKMFLQHGNISTFSGRLLPGIRQLISLPAGLARMPLLPFCLLTALGAGLWSGLLAWLGFRFGQDHEVLAHQLKQNSLWVIISALVLLGGWISWRWYSRRRSSPQA